jgi:hypothetical protein
MLKQEVQFLKQLKDHVKMEFSSLRSRVTEIDIPILTCSKVTSAK